MGHERNSTQHRSGDRVYRGRGGDREKRRFHGREGGRNGRRGGGHKHRGLRSEDSDTSVVWAISGLTILILVCVIIAVLLLLIKYRRRARRRPQRASWEHSVYTEFKSHHQQRPVPLSRAAYPRHFEKESELDYEALKAFARQQLEKSTTTTAHCCTCTHTHGSVNTHLAPMEIGLYNEAFDISSVPDRYKPNATDAFPHCSNCTKSQERTTSQFSISNSKNDNKMTDLTIASTTNYLTVTSHDNDVSLERGERGDLSIDEYHLRPGNDAGVVCTCTRKPDLATSLVSGHPSTSPPPRVELRAAESDSGFVKRRNNHLKLADSYFLRRGSDSIINNSPVINVVERDLLTTVEPSTQNSPDSHNKTFPQETSSVVRVNVNIEASFDLESTKASNRANREAFVFVDTPASPITHDEVLSTAKSDKIQELDQETADFEKRLKIESSKEFMPEESTLSENSLTEAQPVLLSNYGESEKSRRKKDVSDSNVAEEHAKMLPSWDSVDSDENVHIEMHEPDLIDSCGYTAEADSDTDETDFSRENVIRKARRGHSFKALAMKLQENYVVDSKLPCLQSVNVEESAPEVYAPVSYAFACISKSLSPKQIRRTERKEKKKLKRELKGLVFVEPSSAGYDTQAVKIPLSRQNVGYNTWNGRDHRAWLTPSSGTWSARANKSINSPTLSASTASSSGCSSFSFTSDVADFDVEDIPYTESSNSTVTGAYPVHGTAM